jgi:hypothetical protein
MGNEEAVEMLRGGKEALIVAILTFMRARGNTAASTELANSFRPRLAPEDAVLFRSMLKQIASFSKARKTWTLKNEFLEG